MMQGHRTACVSVLIEKADGTIEYKTWRGSNVNRLQAKARTQYAAEFPGCKVSFGRALWTNHYGAH